jgi:hypothetical protein
MKKGQDYARLSGAGLPIPFYDVFDDRCLDDRRESERLAAIVKKILRHGSGRVGVRTETKDEGSSLTNCPHIMPLQTEEQVRLAMTEVLAAYPEYDWWFLVNEAFTSYEWNAVVMVTDQLKLPGGPRLTGEINDKDDLPLRQAMARTENCSTAENWKHPDSQWLRLTILRSGILNEWLEVSSVSSRGTSQRIFWGMR